MIDEKAEGRLRVQVEPVTGPYMWLPLSELPRVRELLDRHRVHYWADPFAITLDKYKKPPVLVINFGRKEDAARLQAILDEAG